MNTKENVLIFAHRGASNIAPENTLKAFEKAIELKADYIEFDVHQPKDGEIVIMHDANDFRTTGHNGIIEKMTLKQLKQLDCGEGERIPTLNELIKIVKGKIGLNCEIKSKGIAEKIVDIFRNANLIDSTIISSFMFTELLELQRLESTLKLGLLIPSEMRSSRMLKRLTEKALKSDFYSIHPYYKFINENYVSFTHENNLKVIVWTVNEDQDIRKAVDLGVDGIISDDILKVKKVLNLRD